jgi:hypothetical protein
VRVLKRSSESGSILAMVPASVLVMLLLSSLAIDNAAHFLAQRELADACAAAANDGATIALQEASLYASERLDIDEAAARATAVSRAAHLGRRWRSAVAADVATPREGVLELELRARAPLPIGAGRCRAPFRATCQATLRRR